MHGLADLAAALHGVTLPPRLKTVTLVPRPARTKALADPLPAPVTTSVEYGLTVSERAVLEFAAKGLQNAEIARQRGVSVGTIKAQMHRIFEKLGTRSRFEAALLYRVALGAERNEPAHAEEGAFDFSWLNQVALSAERLPAGRVLFRQGDAGDRLFFITQGRVRLLEKPGCVMGPKSLFGELGVFSSGHRRTYTAVCDTEVSVLSMDRDQLRRCYRIYPQFAIYILFTIIGRLTADRTMVAQP